MHHLVAVVPSKCAFLCSLNTSALLKHINTHEMERQTSPMDALSVCSIGNLMNPVPEFCIWGGLKRHSPPEDPDEVYDSSKETSGRDLERAFLVPRGKDPLDLAQDPTFCADPEAQDVADTLLAHRIAALEEAKLEGGSSNLDSWVPLGKEPQHAEVHFASPSNEAVASPRPDPHAVYVLAPKQGLVQDPANAHDAAVWSLRKRGGPKRIKKPGKVPGDTAHCTRQWWICSQHPSCPFTCCYDDGVLSVTEGTHTHNHAPPARVRAAPAVRERVREQLLSNPHLQPKQVHVLQVQAAAGAEAARAAASGTRVAPISTRDVMTSKSIENMKYLIIHDALPTADAIKNITTMYASSVRCVELFPTQRIIFATPDQIEFFAAYRGHLMIDTTFDIVEGKLYLTSLLAVHEGFFTVPVAWFIHNTRSGEEYTAFLKKLYDASGNRAQPSAVLRDFAVELRNAITAIWPNVGNFGDLFHLLQANVKWLRCNKYDNALLSAIVADLRTVALAPTRAEFEENLSSFCVRWCVPYPDYGTYFNSQWTVRVNTGEWAMYARPHGIPSGDQQMESYHLHLKNTILNHRGNIKLDLFIKALYDYIIYIFATIASPQLLAAAKQGHRRTTLAAYRGPVRAPEHVGQQSTPPPPLAAVLAAPVAIPAPLANPLIDINPTLPTAPHGRECKCGAKRVNTTCSFHLCMSCCTATSARCVVGTHNQGKVTDSPIVALIDAVLEERKEHPLYVRYQGGSQPGTVRMVTPLRWINRPLSVLMHCPRENIEKKYMVLRIIEARRTVFD